MNTNQLNENPLVSIMMPARNAGRYLANTIASIQKQTYENWELIFVDDGSTDDTLSVIQNIAINEPRIRVFPMPYGGRGRARNTCVEQIRGEFLAVCDADDVSFPDRFEKQVRYLQRHKEIGGVGSAWVPFATEYPGEPTPVRSFPSEPSQLRKAFANKKMRFHNATVMLRSDLFGKYGGYNVELRRAQDYEFFSRLSRNGILFASLPEPLLFYRQEAEVPSITYFRENGMFMAFADRILSGDRQTFDSFSKSISGRFWHSYYTGKFAYFYAKITLLNSIGR
jgi:glycosyltransferase involved in cell wall biosynthesis